MKLWHLVRDNASAVLLGLVRAFTVARGATLFQELPLAVLAVLGVGVASLAFDIEARLAERVRNPIAPEQSLLSLLVAWCLTMAIVIPLNSLCAFSLGVGELKEVSLNTAFADYWVRESERASTWALDSRTQIARLAVATQTEIAAEQTRVTAARREAVPYSAEQLGALRRRLRALNEVARQVGAIQPLPVQPPNDRVKAFEQIGAMFDNLNDAYPAASLHVPALQSPPRAGRFEPPAVDLKSLFVAETLAKSPSATFSWGAALMLEALGFVALWKGGRRISASSRIYDKRHRGRQLWRALVGKAPATPVLFSVGSPVDLTGTWYAPFAGDFTPSECLPVLKEMLAGHPRMESLTIRRLMSGTGELQHHLPLLPQLAGSPLIIEVV